MYTRSTLKTPREIFVNYKTVEKCSNNSNLKNGFVANRVVETNGDAKHNFTVESFIEAHVLQLQIEPISLNQLLSGRQTGMCEQSGLGVLGQRKQTGDDDGQLDAHEETGEEPLAALQLIVQNAVHNVYAAGELANADPPYTASSTKCFAFSLPTLNQNGHFVTFPTVQCLCLAPPCR